MKIDQLEEVLARTESDLLTVLGMASGTPAAASIMDAIYSVREATAKLQVDTYSLVAKKLQLDLLTDVAESV